MYFPFLNPLENHNQKLSQTRPRLFKIYINLRMKKKDQEKILKFLSQDLG